MNIEQHIITATVAAVKELYQQHLPENQVSLQDTRAEFEGQVTIVVFPVVRFSKLSPEATATALGEYLVQHVKEITGFNVVKGFLNLSISDAYWINLFNSDLLNPSFGVFSPNGKKVMVEYSSPNTNKPLHLGHVRNNLSVYRSN